MANDNLLAGVAGFAKGLGDVLVPYTTKKLEEESELRKIKAREVPVSTVESILGIKLNLPEGTTTLSGDLAEKLVQYGQQKQVYEQTDEGGLKELGRVPYGSTVLPMPTKETLVTSEGTPIMTGKNKENITVVKPEETPEARLDRIGKEEEIKQQVRKKYRTKVIPSSQATAVRSMNESIEYIDNMIKIIDSGSVKTGLSKVRFWNNPVSNIFLEAFGSTAESDFSSNLIKTQGSFVTSQTGSQRGFPELQFFLPALPTKKMKTSKFRALLIKAKESMNNNRNGAIELLEKAGYTTSELDDLYNPEINVESGIEEIPAGFDMAE